MLRKKNAAVFTEAHGKCAPDKEFDMRISNFKAELFIFKAYRKERTFEAEGTKVKNEEHFSCSSHILCNLLR